MSRFLSREALVGGYLPILGARFCDAVATVVLDSPFNCYQSGISLQDEVFHLLSGPESRTSEKSTHPYITSSEFIF